MPETIQMQSIPVEKIKPNGWNRTVFDPAQLEELVSTIKEDGIHEPLIVRPMPPEMKSAATGQAADLPEMWQIASGHRHWLAAQKAGLTEVPCEVVPMKDEEVAQDNIALNVQRENIPQIALAL